MSLKSSRPLAVLGLAAAVSAFGVGCSSPPKTAPAPAGPATTAAPATSAPAAATGADTAAAGRAARDAAARDSAARAAAARDAAMRKVRDDSIAAVRLLASKTMAELRQTLMATVYFDYDKADVRDDTRAAIELKLPILAANPKLRVRIQGHTDERGSDEYNLALGQRRAATIKRYFTDHGVDESRIEIVSFGRERPASAGDDDATRAKNRRCEFEILSGGDALTAPK
jgi:peptidoglycan-associated lipoprotein